MGGEGDGLYTKAAIDGAATIHLRPALGTAPCARPGSVPRLAGFAIGGPNGAPSGAGCARPVNDSLTIRTQRSAQESLQARRTRIAA